jgi:hypothetical protein
MSSILFKAFLALAPVILTLFLLHVRAYRQLCQSLKSRGYPVDGLKVGLLDFGSGGCMNKLKTIERRIGEGGLSSAEKCLLRKSKIFYYLPGIGIVLFIIGVAFILIEGLQG